jgi:hypothetical protein
MKNAIIIYGMSGNDVHHGLIYQSRKQLRAVFDEATP